jgi:hypothetical protein
MKEKIALYLFRAYMVYSITADILLLSGIGYLIFK